ncbi:MAG: FMN-dependent NADH-azoreductase [Marinicellaceae bacterium]
MTCHTILHIDSSMRSTDSLSRQVGKLVSDKLLQENPSLTLNYRDVAQGLPLIDEEWIKANFTPEHKRDDKAIKTLEFSDKLVSELKQAKYIVIAAPTYNFNIPAYLKAWVDLIARARLTFRYTENGPVGLLKDKKAYLIIASGGVPIGSDADFVSQYLNRIMSFIGITDVKIIDASKVNLEEITDNYLEALIA